MIKRYCGLKDLSAKDLEKFLNDPCFSRGRASSDVHSTWSLLPKVLLCFACKISIDGTNVSLHFGGKTVESHQRTRLKQLVRSARDVFRPQQLLDKTDQGRSFHWISRSWYSSYWVNGKIH